MGQETPDAGPGFEYEASLTADFEWRDTLLQTDVPEDEWFDRSSWGPPAATYPEVAVPAEVEDLLQWKRDRVIAAAKHFIGTLYEHRHIPAAGGLDCSNYTSWVYNYAFGIRFTSHVVNQSNALEAGRLLAQEELRCDRTRGHLHRPGPCGRRGLHHRLDRRRDCGVTVRRWQNWKKTQYSHARRIFE
ncbi:MAG: hypothetical protein WBV82_00085 [Myxococcaceae bacterium]